MGDMNNETTLTDSEITDRIAAQILDIASYPDTELWASNPERAARLAFLAVQLAWKAQTEFIGPHFGMPNLNLNSNR